MDCQTATGNGMKGKREMKKQNQYMEYSAWKRTLLRKTATGLEAWNLEKLKEAVKATADAEKRSALLHNLRHSIAAKCDGIDNTRAFLTSTAERIETGAPDWIEIGGKKMRLGATGYIGNEPYQLTPAQIAADYGAEILDCIFKMPKMVYGETDETPRLLDLRQVADDALPQRQPIMDLRQFAELTKDERQQLMRERRQHIRTGNLTAQEIRVLIGNAFAALRRLLKTWQSQCPKSAEAIEESIIDIEDFDRELFKGYSQRLLELQKKLLADLRRVRVASANLDAQAQTATPPNTTGKPKNKERTRYPKDREAKAVLKEAARRKGCKSYSGDGNAAIIKYMINEPQSKWKARILYGKLKGKASGQGREHSIPIDAEKAAKKWGGYLSAYMIDHTPKQGA